MMNLRGQSDTITTNTIQFMTSKSIRAFVYLLRDVSKKDIALDKDDVLTIDTKEKRETPIFKKETPIFTSNDYGNSSSSFFRVPSVLSSFKLTPVETTYLDTVFSSVVQSSTTSDSDDSMIDNIQYLLYILFQKMGGGIGKVKKLSYNGNVKYMYFEDSSDLFNKDSLLWKLSSYLFDSTFHFIVRIRPSQKSKTLIFFYPSKFDNDSFSSQLWVSTIHPHLQLQDDDTITYLTIRKLLNLQTSSSDTYFQKVETTEDPLFTAYAFQVYKTNLSSFYMKWDTFQKDYINDWLKVDEPNKEINIFFIQYWIVMKLFSGTPHERNELKNQLYKQYIQSFSSSDVQIPSPESFVLPSPLSDKFLTTTKDQWKTTYQTILKKKYLEFLAHLRTLQDSRWLDSLVTTENTSVPYDESTLNGRCRIRVLENEYGFSLVKAYLFQKMIDKSTTTTTTTTTTTIECIDFDKVKYTLLGVERNDSFMKSILCCQQESLISQYADAYEKQYIFPPSQLDLLKENLETHLNLGDPHQFIDFLSYQRFQHMFILKKVTTAVKITQLKANVFALQHQDVTSPTYREMHCFLFVIEKGAYDEFGGIAYAMVWVQPFAFYFFHKDTFQVRHDFDTDKFLNTIKPLLPFTDLVSPTVLDWTFFSPDTFSVYRDFFVKTMRFDVSMLNSISCSSSSLSSPSIPSFSSPPRHTIASWIKEKKSLFTTTPKKYKKGDRVLFLSNDDEEEEGYVELYVPLPTRLDKLRLFKPTSNDDEKKQLFIERNYQKFQKIWDKCIESKDTSSSFLVMDESNKRYCLLLLDNDIYVYPRSHFMSSNTTFSSLTIVCSSSYETWHGVKYVYQREMTTTTKYEKKIDKLPSVYQAIYKARSSVFSLPLLSHKEENEKSDFYLIYGLTSKTLKKVLPANIKQRLPDPPTFATDSEYITNYSAWFSRSEDEKKEDEDKKEQEDEDKKKEEEKKKKKIVDRCTFYWVSQDGIIVSNNQEGKPRFWKINASSNKCEYTEGVSTSLTVPNTLNNFHTCYHSHYYQPDPLQDIHCLIDNKTCTIFGGSGSLRKEKNFDTQIETYYDSNQNTKWLGKETFTHGGSTWYCKTVYGDEEITELYYKKEDLQEVALSNYGTFPTHRVWTLIYAKEDSSSSSSSTPIKTLVLSSKQILFDTIKKGSQRITKITYNTKRYHVVGSFLYEESTLEKLDITDEIVKKMSQPQVMQVIERVLYSMVSVNPFIFKVDPFLLNDGYQCLSWLDLFSELDSMSGTTTFTVNENKVDAKYRTAARRVAEANQKLWEFNNDKYIVGFPRMMILLQKGSERLPSDDAKNVLKKTFLQILGHKFNTIKDKVKQYRYTIEDGLDTLNWWDDAMLITSIKDIIQALWEVNIDDIIQKMVEKTTHNIIKSTIRVFENPKELFFDEGLSFMLGGLFPPLFFMLTIQRFTKAFQKFVPEQKRGGHDSDIIETYELMSSYDCRNSTSSSITINEVEDPIIIFSENENDNHFMYKYEMIPLQTDILQLELMQIEAKKEKLVTLLKNSMTTEKRRKGGFFTRKHGMKSTPQRTRHGYKHRGIDPRHIQCPMK